MQEQSDTRLLLESTLLSNWLLGWIAHAKIPSKDLKKTAHRHTNQQIRLNAARHAIPNMLLLLLPMCIAAAILYGRCYCFILLCYNFIFRFNDVGSLHSFLPIWFVLFVLFVCLCDCAGVFIEFVHGAPLTWVSSYTIAMESMLMAHKRHSHIEHIVQYVWWTFKHIALMHVVWNEFYDTFFLCVLMMLLSGRVYTRKIGTVICCFGFVFLAMGKCLESKVKLTIRLKRFFVPFACWTDLVFNWLSNLTTLINVTQFFSSNFPKQN